MPGTVYCDRSQVSGDVVSAPATLDETLRAPCGSRADEQMTANRVETAHYRAALSSVEQNVRVRAKEYYDLHPSLAELATDPRQIVRYQPAFYSVPSDLWSREQAFVRSTLGQPRGTVREAVLEIKRRASAPPWLDELLTGVGVRPIAHSKFVAATDAVFSESRAR